MAYRVLFIYISLTNSTYNKLNNLQVHVTSINEVSNSKQFILHKSDIIIHISYVTHHVTIIIIFYTSSFYNDSVSNRKIMKR